jgi:hypothetical protein
MSLIRCLGRTKVSVQVRGFVCQYFVTKIRFHSEELLAPLPTPHQARVPPLVGCPRQLIQYILVPLHIGGRSSIRNPTTRHAVVTRTPLTTWAINIYPNQIQFFLEKSV